MKIVLRIKNLLLYPGAYLYFVMQSHRNWMRSLFKADNIRFENTYNGQKILLLALYEKGELREDIEHLLEIVKKQDVYVICVNTLRLSEPEQYTEVMDCYIERYNYGRDFGSYKTGFLHLYKRQLHEKCPRLVILNDSLFYSKKNQAAFINDLFKTEVEALGATENHEIEHHLGSFCLSLAGSVIKNKSFIRYWRKYSNSDVRPVVIKRGEMGLSKVLRYCVSSQDNFTALYDLTRFTEYLNNNPGFMCEVTNMYRVPDMYRPSEFIDWHRPSLKNVVKRINSKYITSDPVLKHIDANIDLSINNEALYFVDSISSLKEFISTIAYGNIADLDEKIREEIKNDLLECFTIGSQIHQNAIILHKLGLPIIKLDGLFRGMFSVEDINNLSKQLDEHEKNNFRRLLNSKPFGGKVLYGWKRAAFYRGLI